MRDTTVSATAARRAHARWCATAGLCLRSRTGTGCLLSRTRSLRASSRAAMSRFSSRLAWRPRSISLRRARTASPASPALQATARGCAHSASLGTSRAARSAWRARTRSACCCRSATRFFSG
eukprot:Amastigsp_a845146_2.p2 type:complete len:122 gc:universal Amastigsp_a845146_2:492-127(-)